MTAKRLAEFAIDEALTAALINDSIRSTAISAGALAAISRYGNQIPDELAEEAVSGFIRAEWVRRVVGR